MITLADAILYHEMDTIKSIIKRDSNVNFFDEYGFTPLIESAIMNKPEICEILLKNHADPNLLDTTGRSALHWACDNNNLEIASKLLANGANANCTTDTGQSPLTFPLLRNQNKMRTLLINHGANIELAQSFIYAKLIGHRFHLTGKVHIVSPEQEFILVDFEGFFSEFTLSIIKQSFEQYQTNYANRAFVSYNLYTRQIINALDNAHDLTKFQHYNIPLSQYQATINNRLQKKLLLLPVVYEGHAIALVRYKNWLAKCDRGANSLQEGCINIYKINNPEHANSTLWKNLLYKKQTSEFIHQELNHVLGLKPMWQLPIPTQITGNCAWANIESAIPAMLYLLKQPHSHQEQEKQTTEILEYYTAWISWDKFRAVNEYINRYRQADKTRKASIVAVLLAILFKMIQDGAKRHNIYVKRILPIIKVPQYYYMTQCYLKHFVQKHPTSAGIKLKDWLGIT